MRTPAIKPIKFTDKKPVLPGIYAFRKNRIYKRAGGITLVNVELIREKLYVITRLNQRLVYKVPVSDVVGQFSANPFEVV